MDANKIEAYLGFAKRAGKLTLGQNAIATLKKGVFCLLLDGEAAKNSQKEARKLRARFSCPLIIVKDLGSLVKREGCKIAAVKDASLAAAVLKEASEQDMTIEGAIG